MKLVYEPEPSGRYTTGYWSACTDGVGYDGDGLTPLEALADLVVQMEAALDGRDGEGRDE